MENFILMNLYFMISMRVIFFYLLTRSLSHSHSFRPCTTIYLYIIIICIRLRTLHENSQSVPCNIADFFFTMLFYYFFFSLSWNRNYHNIVICIRHHRYRKCEMISFLFGRSLGFAVYIYGSAIYISMRSRGIYD